MALLLYLSHFGETKCAELPVEGTIGDLFEEAARQLDVDPRRIRICYQGTEFTKMDMPLADASLSNEATVEVELGCSNDWRGIVTGNAIALRSEEIEAALEFVLSSNGWFRMQDKKLLGQDRARMVWSGGWPREDDTQSYDEHTIQAFKSPETKMKPLVELTDQPGSEKEFGKWKCYSTTWGSVWTSTETTPLAAVTTRDAAYILGKKDGQLPSGTMIPAKERARQMTADAEVEWLLDMMYGEVPQVVAMLTEKRRGWGRAGRAPYRSPSQARPGPRPAADDVADPDGAYVDAEPKKRRCARCTIM